MQLSFKNLDPTDPKDAQDDFDSDGIEGDEILRGTNMFSSIVTMDCQI